MTSPSDDHHLHRKKRVGKACDLCRIKKAKCDGKKPCSRCIADNKLCAFSDRRKSKDKPHPSGYIELLETRIELLTKSLLKIVTLAEPHVPFLQPILERARTEAPSPISDDLHDGPVEVAIPINEIVDYLINNHNLLDNEWDLARCYEAAAWPPDRSALFAENQYKPLGLPIPGASRRGLVDLALALTSPQVAAAPVPLASHVRSVLTQSLDCLDSLFGLGQTILPVSLLSSHLESHNLHERGRYGKPAFKPKRQSLGLGLTRALSIQVPHHSLAPQPSPQVGRSVRSDSPTQFGVFTQPSFRAQFFSNSPAAQLGPDVALDPAGPFPSDLGPAQAAFFPFSNTSALSYNDLTLMGLPPLSTPLDSDIHSDLPSKVTLDGMVPFDDMLTTNPFFALAT